MLLTKRGDWWHLAGRDPRNWRKHLSIALGTKDEMEALIIAGEISANIKRGIEPKAAATKIKLLSLVGLGDRDQGIRDLHIDPFFGNYKPMEMTQEIIEGYMVKRWGRTPEGKILAVKNTWKKEKDILTRIMRLVDPTWKVPKIDYKALFKKRLPPLTLDLVEMVSKYVIPKYQDAYWIMAYTSMDVLDAVTLAPCHLKMVKDEDGKTHLFIVKVRHKTEHRDKPQVIEVPVCRGLRKLLMDRPQPIEPEEPYLNHLNNKNVSQRICDAFDRAGLEGYGSKYLRYYVSSILLDNGYGEDWINKALAHAEGSDVTMGYPDIYKGTLVKAFKHLDRRMR